MYFIAFLDLKNIGIDIKIMVIGALGAILWAKTCFVVAILNFLILGGNRWSDVVVPAIFEISIPKTKDKVSCFFPEVHNSSKNCYISAPLYTIFEIIIPGYVYSKPNVNVLCETVHEI